MCVSCLREKTLSIQLKRKRMSWAGVAGSLLWQLGSLSGTLADFRPNHTVVVSGKQGTMRNTKLACSKADRALRVEIHTM